MSLAYRTLSMNQLRLLVSTRRRSRVWTGSCFNVLIAWRLSRKRTGRPQLYDAKLSCAYQNDNRRDIGGRLPGYVVPPIEEDEDVFNDRNIALISFFTCLAHFIGKSGAENKRHFLTTEFELSSCSLYFKFCHYVMSYNVFFLQKEKYWSQSNVKVHENDMYRSAATSKQCNPLLAAKKGAIISLLTR